MLSPRNSSEVSWCSHAKSTRWKKTDRANTNQKEAGVAEFVLDKVDFRMKKVARDKGPYIMIKVSIWQEGGIEVLNMCAPKDKDSQYVKQQPWELRRKKVLLWF